ncbi:MAG: hypothetical protein ILP12_03990 [Lachnospiraceae bacterium]|nr:hypothetical protein [Lachnospiraceae bacterium]
MKMDWFGKVLVDEQHRGHEMATSQLPPKQAKGPKTAPFSALSEVKNV